MNKKFEQLRDEAKKALEQIRSLPELTEIKNLFLGRKGKINELMKELKDLTDEHRKEFGKFANELKTELESFFDQAAAVFQKEETKHHDLTLPGKKQAVGTLHPITQMIAGIWDIFSGMNFQIHTGREVENDYYNFESLNIPKDHPARDMQDTFYTENDLLLRTHTSSLQVRFMESMKEKKAFRVLFSGKCYRRDSDITHSPMFHQFEGLMIGKDITFSHLKNILQSAMSQLLQKEVRVRFRTSYFAFVEPGAEFDVSCTICDQKGCPTCKRTGWLEMGGCGMVHPNVLRAGGYDPEVWQGFAFGFGVERPIMIKYAISDIRLFFANDVRFLKQFSS